MLSWYSYILIILGNVTIALSKLIDCRENVSVNEKEISVYLKNIIKVFFIVTCFLKFKMAFKLWI